MVSRKFLGLAVVAAAIPLALSGCSPSGTGSDPTSGATGGVQFDGTFTVYASLGVTGSLSSIAQANIDGLNAAVKQINSEGGIAHKEVKLVVGDDGADPTKAATLLQQQLDKGPVDLVVAGNTSAVGLSLLPLTTREKIITTGQQAAINDPAKYPYQFGMVIPNSTQTQAMLQKVQQAGYKKVAFLGANDANGTAVASTYQKLFQGAGIGFVAESFSPDAVDMTAQLQRLQAQSPDVLILSGLGAVAGYELQSRTKIGWNIPTLGHTDLGTNDLSAVSGAADWKNLQVMTFYSMNPSATRTKGFQELMTDLKAEGSKINLPIAQYTVMWDLLWVAKHVWENSADTPEARKATYESLNLTATADSPYTFVPYIKYSATNHQLVIEPKDGMAFITPGPFVDGLPKS